MSDRFGFRSKAGNLRSSSKANEGKTAPAGSKRPIESTTEKENVPSSVAPKKTVRTPAEPPSYMRPTQRSKTTSKMFAARKSVAKAKRRSVAPVKRTVGAKPAALRREASTLRTKTLTTASARAGTRAGAASSRAAATTKPAAKEPVLKENKEEDAGPSSRVKLTSEGKIIVKGVKKFDLKERCNVLEIVLAEKITSAKQTEQHLKMLTDAVESIKGEKQVAQTEAKGLQEYKMAKEAEFDNLEERLQNAQRDVRKLKNELESTSDSLDETQKRLKSVKLERDSLQEDFEGAGKKIDQLKRKIELQEDDLKKLESEKENLLEDKTEMREKMDAMEDERRMLHETIQQLKGNIRVFVRVRPLLPKELEEKHSSEHISFENALDKGIEITREDKKDEKAEFQFDAVFKPDSTQIQIFGEVSQLVRSSLDGYNVTIFAYGQTGSGKTFSMEGPEDVYENEEMQGIIPRSFGFLIEAVEKSKEKGWIYKLEASYLEVYCEELNDLLEGGDKKLKVEGTGSKHINVANLSRHEITSKNQLSNLVKRANKRRKTASTNCNERSSRSHSVFILFVSGENTRNGQKVESCLNLVDLAGSERVKESGATGQRFEEAKKINGSLSSLGDVIAALGSKSKHIPYRNSKLTHLLQNSLGGNSKTLMIMHLNPRKLYANESFNTLRFAQKVNSTNIGTAQKISK